jgi:hypothetical protein
MALQANQLVGRLEVFGVPRASAVPIARTIVKWVRTNGKEWTVDHLKLIKQTIISLEAGYSQGISPFVKTNGRRVVGHFGVLQDLVFKHKKAAFSSLLAYTSFVASGLTKKQKSKFLDAVERPLPSKANPLTYWDDIDFYGIKIPYSLSHPGRLEDRTGSRDRFMPTNDFRSIPEIENLLEQMLFWYENDSIWGYCNPYKVSSTLSTYLMSLSRYSITPSFSMKEELPSHVGFVSVIQEPGFKARFIANPSRFWQQALEPLGDMLFGLLRKVPWDCTYNQDHGIPLIQKHLGLGKSAYSVDLSNATDQFPLDIQTSLIKKLTIPMVYGTKANGRPHHLSEPNVPMLMGLFEALSRAPMWMQSEKRYVRWVKGQPLGLYPSFALFAFTHGMLLFQLSKRLNLEVLEDSCPFYVLGDDVVILNDDLYTLYMKELDLLGVQVSKPKSLTSNSYVEFAGKLISSDGVMGSFKWRNISPDNWFDVLRNVGPKGLQILPRHIRDVAESVVSMPEPWGFGWNPNGLRLEERLGNLLEAYFHDLHPLPPVGRLGASLYEDIRFRTRNRAVLNTIRKELPSVAPVEQTRAEVGNETVRNLFLSGLIPPGDLVKTINHLIFSRLVTRDEGQRIYDNIVIDFPERLGITNRSRVSLLDQWKHRLLRR